MCEKINRTKNNIKGTGFNYLLKYIKSNESGLIFEKELLVNLI